MIAKENSSDCRGTSRTRQRMVRAFWAFLLLGGMAYATPIMDLGSNDVRDAVPLVRLMGSQLSSKSNFSIADSRSAPHLSISSVASAQPASDTCVFSSNCSSTVKVPEPQSLMLLGSGLLSMAGLIRKKLIR
jgi:hypothetical protein